MKNNYSAKCVYQDRTVIIEADGLADLIRKTREFSQCTTCSLPYKWVQEWRIEGKTYTQWEEVFKLAKEAGLVPYYYTMCHNEHVKMTYDTPERVKSILKEV